MAEKKCILFQRSLNSLGSRGGCMADETVESLTIKFGMILEYLKEIKGSLNDLPCDDLGKDVAENSFEIKYLKELVGELKKEKDDEIYPRLRKVEESGTIKIKWIITVVLSGIMSAGFAIMAYKMTRGV